MNFQLIICLKTVKANLDNINNNVQTNINHRKSTENYNSGYLFVCFFTSPVSVTLSIFQLLVL